MRVQVVGLQRSGTNWIQDLIARNFDVTMDRGFKHFLPGETTNPNGHDADIYVVVEKRLDHWLNSVYRWPVDMPKCRPECYHKDGSLRWVRAAAIHQIFNRAWRKARPNALFVRYGHPP